MGLARAANLPVIACRRHRPRRAAGPPVRDGRGARARRPATHLRVRGQQVPRRPRAAGARARRSCAELTGRPTYGVIPYTDGLWLDTEDSVSVLAHRVVGDPQPPRGREWLRVAAIRLPRISNSTDVEALACEPGVLVRWVTDPADLADADVVVIPGSKATVADLGWLRERGLADGITAHAGGQAGAGHLRRLPDAVPAHRRPGGIQGGPRRRPRPARRRHRVRAGQDAAAPRRRDCTATRSTTASSRAATEDDWLGVGIRRGHGVRHALARPARQQRLSPAVARRAPRPRPAGSSSPTTSTSPARRDAQLDLMADLLTAHLDVDAVVGLLENGPPQRPTIVTST